MNQIALNNAVTIQPLTKDQIDTFLTNAGEPFKILRQILDRDPVLQELASTPLMLSILTLASRSKMTEELLTEDPIKTQQQGYSSGFLSYLLGPRRMPEIPISALQQEVFATYVQQMLNRRGRNNHYTPQQTIFWLSWLAKKINRNEINKTSFSRPDSEWLPEGWPNNFYQGCMLSLTLILLVIWLVGITILFFRWLNILSLVPIPFEWIALTGLALPGVKYIVAENDKIHIEAAKNQGIASFLLFLLITIIVFLLPHGWLIFILSILLGPISLVLLLGSPFIFKPILYMPTRVLLYWSGCMPWKYQYFLTYAAQRLLLRKVGDKYIFIHDLLYKYFAYLNIKSPKS